MHPTKRIRPLIASALMITGIAGSAGAHGLEIEAAWTFETPSVADSHIAYLTIVNEAFHPEYLYIASTPVASRVELHQVTGASGVTSRMVRVKRLEIPLDDRLDMKRAGYHLMLIGVKRALKPGENIPISLTFGEGRVEKSSITVSAAGTVPKPSDRSATGTVPGKRGHQQKH